jgi:hypothetical protein
MGTRHPTARATFGTSCTSGTVLAPGEACESLCSPWITHQNTWRPSEGETDIYSHLKLGCLRLCCGCTWALVLQHPQMAPHGMEPSCSSQAATVMPSRSVLGRHQQRLTCGMLQAAQPCGCQRADGPAAGAAAAPSNNSRALTVSTPDTSSATTAHHKCT